MDWLNLQAFLGDTCGSLSGYLPSISGYDYVVAAWGDGSTYAYNLAEKVWMALGLTPRCEGNDQQRIVYDDLREPVFAVAEGEISSSHCWVLQKNVTWRMSNEFFDDISGCVERVESESFL